MRVLIYEQDGTPWSEMVKKYEELDDILKSYNFKGLNELSKQYDGSLYRYFFGNATSFSSAKKLLNKAKKAGYSNAFLVGFVEGKKVSLEAALEAIR